MNIEQLKEKARLTKDEVHDAYSREAIRFAQGEEHPDAVNSILKAQLDKAFNTFLTWCDENGVCKVREYDLFPFLNGLKSVRDYLKEQEEK